MSFAIQLRGSALISYVALSLHEVRTKNIAEKQPIIKPYYVSTDVKNGNVYIKY